MEAISQWAYELITSRHGTSLPGRCALSSGTPPRYAMCWSELDQLDEEFDGVALDPKNHAITVRLEPITLKDIYLGPFKVES